MKNLENQIFRFEPFCEVEAKDREYMLEVLELERDLLIRYNLMHFTSSAFVVNPNRDKMLCVYHNIYQGLIYPGGHADGESDLLSVAVREVPEETGVKPRVLSDDIFGLTVNPVSGHVKRGEYVSGHTHLDFIYLMECDEDVLLKYNPGESSDVCWLPFSEAYGDKVVDYMRPVNSRLIMKLDLLGK